MLDDIVAVLLGCDQLMVLRLASSRQFRVIGPCYIQGMMDAEGLLGPVIEPWQAQRRNVNGYYTPHFFNTHTGVVSTEDPRLPPLPDEWEQMPRKRTADDPYNFLEFKSKLTGMVINSDPRMLPESLTEQNVDLQTIQLI